MTDTTLPDLPLLAEQSISPKSEPRVMFCLDDGNSISFWQHHIGKAEELGDVLTIEAGKGKIEIRGPKVKALHRDLCRGKATMIKSPSADFDPIAARNPRRSDAPRGKQE